MKQPIIDCDVHDLIEIICMRRYEVRLFLQDGSTRQGVASTTVARQGTEYLLLQQQQQQLEMPLLEISRIDVLTPGAEIQHIIPTASGSCTI